MEKAPPSDALSSKAMKATVEAAWVINLEVFLINDGPEEGSEANKRKVMGVLQSPDIHVADVRRLIRDATKIPEKEQRLSLAGSSSGEPVFHGAMPSPDPEGTVSLLLRQVPLDPRLGALFRMVCMDSVDERNELMALMMKPRGAGGCFDSNHPPLARLGDEDEDLASFCCAKCGEVCGDLLACKECNFAICAFCHPDDEGWAPPADPHARLTEQALDLGGEMARVGGWFGGRGHFCGHPRIQCRSGIAPCAYRGRAGNEGGVDAGVEMHRGKQVLHGGVRLRIVLSEKVRDILIGRDKDYAKMEINRVLPAGATIQDMISYRGELKKSKLWPIVAKDLENQFSYYQTRDGDQARAYQTVTMLSFGIEEAVYELDAKIDDGDY